MRASFYRMLSATKRTIPPIFLALVLVSGTAYAVGNTTRVSVSSTGAQGKDGMGQYAGSFSGSISGNGRWVVFETAAMDLVPGYETSGQILLRDLQLGKTTIVSLSNAGIPSNGYNAEPTINSSGRFVAFVANSDDLAGPASGWPDIFVRDRDTDADGVFDEAGAVATTRESVSATGGPANNESSKPVISANGRFVTFDSFASNLVGGDTNGKKDVFVRDLQLRKTTRVSVSSARAQGNNSSFSPVISDTGRYVAFGSSASNLVSGDTNGFADVFFHDRDTDGDAVFDEAGAVATSRVSVSSTGAQANSWSGGIAINSNGRFVSFMSRATNLVGGDTNGMSDSFVRDRRTGKTTRLSVSSGGSQGNADSGLTAMSASGRIVIFSSDARNLVSGDTNAKTDVFVRDRDTDADGIFDEVGAVSTTRASVSSTGAQANGESWPQKHSSRIVSADGRYVVLDSDASNLVSGDTNGKMDVFVRDRGAP